MRHPTCFKRLPSCYYFSVYQFVLSLFFYVFRIKAFQQQRSHRGAREHVPQPLSGRVMGLSRRKFRWWKWGPVESNVALGQPKEIKIVAKQTFLGAKNIPKILLRLWLRSVLRWRILQRSSLRPSWIWGPPSGGERMMLNKRNASQLLNIVYPLDS